MVKATDGSGVKHTFTCGEWSVLNPALGWVAYENNCGSALDSYHRPFASTDLTQAQTSVGLRPLVKIVEAADFSPLGVISLLSLGIVVEYDYQDRLSVYEGGQLINPVSSYLVDVALNELKILEFIAFQRYTIVYFQ